jgi:spermidine/putrescine transport system substrate-binding protein
MNKLLCALLFGLSMPLFAEEAKELNLYNWAEYLPKTVLDKFTQETGIKVNYATYDTNEVMYAKVKTLKGEGYDLVVPSNYYVSRMIRENMLTKLDLSKLTSFKNLDPKLLNQPFDPNNQYSVPYTWGTTGIGFNTKHIKTGVITKWADLWDSKYKNSLLMLDDMREVMGMGLKVLGYASNDTNEEHIKQAYEKLLTLLPNVKMFYAESPKIMFLEGEVKSGMIWNGEAFIANRENKEIQYVYPNEGVTLWVDNLVIPQGAKHLENAYKFINFILRPEIGKIIAEEIGYASPNLEVLKLLPKQITENRIAYPSAEDLKNAQLQQDVGDALVIFEKYWQKLKVAAGKQ